MLKSRVSSVLGCSLAALSACIGIMAVDGWLAPSAAAEPPLVSGTVAQKVQTQPLQLTPWSVTADGSGFANSIPGGNFLNYTENFLLTFASVNLVPSQGIWLAAPSTINVQTTAAQGGATLPAGTHTLKVSVANGSTAQTVSVYATTGTIIDGFPQTGALLGSCNLPAADSRFQTVNTCSVPVAPTGGQINVNVKISFSAIFKSITLVQ
jgi:hypothetical protein